MPTTASLPPLSPLALSLARLDKLARCGPRLPLGQLDAMKRDPQFQARMEGIGRVLERGERIAFAIGAARAELAARAARKTKKGGRR